MNENATDNFTGNTKKENIFIEHHFQMIIREH